jgi:hypothetical protein
VLYRAAEGSLRKRWAAFLPIKVQARLVWENRRGRLRYGEAAGYALRSTVKPAMLLAFLAIIAWGTYAFYQESIERAQAQAIVDRLDDLRPDGNRAALDLWSGPANVRARVVSKLLDSPGRLRACGTNWVIAVVALDVGAANALAKDLRTQLARADLDPDTRQALWSAVGRVAGRLNEGSEEVNTLAKDLRTQLARTDLDPVTRRELWDALALAGGKVVGNQPDDVRRRVTTLLVSVAFPLRAPSGSPAWAILEQAAQRSFNKDASAMMEWAMGTYGLRPDAARPDVARQNRQALREH